MNSRPARRALAILGLIVFGSILAGVILEVGVLLVLGEQVRFPRHVVGAEFGVRINQPNARYRHRSADVNVAFRINSRGLRDDREFPYAKPDAIKRIVSLGDSFTVGYEVEVEQAFSRVVERELGRLGHRVEVLNAGVSGYSNAEALVYLERELLRYDPDLVLASFYGNDLVDNVRSGLFRLEGGRLEQVKQSYVPAGRLGDFLNTSSLFNLLSERSNAFALLKERATLLIKARIVEQNRDNVRAAEAPQRGPSDDAGMAQRRLAAALFERMHATLREREIPLVIQSIPSYVSEPPDLRELFPLDELDVERAGLVFFAARDVLRPLLGREPLYHERSHRHWTPLSHQAAGAALARLVHERGLLGE